MSPERSSPPHFARIACGGAAAVPSHVEIDAGCTVDFNYGVHERDFQPALAADRGIRKRATQRADDPERRSIALEESRGDASRALTTALSVRDYKHAIEILWKVYRKDVLRYCRRMLDNDTDAADMTQRVFEDAITGLRRLRSVDKALGWLVGIARHRCLDHARSARRDPRLVDANALWQIAAVPCSAEPAQDPQAMNLLGECLARLDACDRVLIELRYYKELPFKVIAKQLGRTPTALRVRLTRACRRLRRYLAAKLVKDVRCDPSQPSWSRGRRLHECQSFASAELGFMIL